MERSWPVTVWPRWTLSWNRESGTFFRRIRGSSGGGRRVKCDTNTQEKLQEPVGGLSRASAVVPASEVSKRFSGDLQLPVRNEVDMRKIHDARISFSKRRFGRWRGAALAGICCLCFAQDTPRPPRAVATFQMSESFGVAWPDQPIEFRYDKGRPPLGSTRMIGPAGTEVPYQWVTSCSDATALNGCILVHSGLPRIAHYTWTLESGPAPTAPVLNPVKVTETAGNYEIGNGLTGVRIVTPSGNPKPWDRAPIQGILLRSGVWTGVGPAPYFLYAEAPSQAGSIGSGLRTKMYTDRWCDGCQRK